MQHLPITQSFFQTTDAEMPGMRDMHLLYKGEK
jgi:hypothetical protein